MCVSMGRDQKQVNQSGGSEGTDNEDITDGRNGIENDAVEKMKKTNLTIE